MRACTIRAPTRAESPRCSSDERGDAALVISALRRGDALSGSAKVHCGIHLWEARRKRNTIWGSPKQSYWKPHVSQGQSVLRRGLGQCAGVEYARGWLVADPDATGAAARLNVGREAGSPMSASVKPASPISASVKPASLIATSSYPAALSCASE